MRTPTAAVVAVLLVGSTALAAEPMAPSDIQAIFFNGQPFTGSTPSGGTKFKMTFTPAGKMIREPLAQSGYKNKARGGSVRRVFARPGNMPSVPASPSFQTARINGRF